MCDWPQLILSTLCHTSSVPSACAFGPVSLYVCGALHSVLSSFACCVCPCREYMTYNTCLESCPASECGFYAARSNQITKQQGPLDICYTPGANPPGEWW
jgi:hypothetical protein